MLNLLMRKSKLTKSGIKQIWNVINDIIGKPSKHINKLIVLQIEILISLNLKLKFVMDIMNSL